MKQPEIDPLHGSSDMERNFLTSLRAAAKVPLGETPGQFGLDRLRRTLERHRREQRRLRLWRSITALVATLLVGVVAVDVYTERDDPQYHALQGASRAALQVRFQATATTIQLQDLFRDLGLEVVSGPSAAGVWHLRLRGADTPAAREEALARLRATPALVEFAEVEP